MRATISLTSALLMWACLARPANAVPASQVHVVLFVPQGVQPPRNYQSRIDELVAYAESFFRRELRRWGHEKSVMPFRRGTDGRVEVTVIRGKKPIAQYEPVPLRAEVMDAMREAKRVDGGRQVWWIMVYAGEPPARFQGFLGGFGVQIGGWALCNFDTTPGRIDPARPLGSEFLAALMLKGMLHELGHGFQLPHIGPLDGDKAGNTLMGPTHVNYRRVRGKAEERVYLSEAEAAILSMQPVFRGVLEDPGTLPRLETPELTYVSDSRNNRLIVRGRVRASKRAVYALVADESDARPGEYWTKTYVGKVAPDGTFEVVVMEPAAANGTLRTWFVFENGSVTGDGRTRSRGSGVPKTYTYRQQQWSFGP